MAVDVLSLIDKATDRANAPRASRKPVFIFLKEGEKVMLRPLVNLPQAIVMQKHNKWHDNRDYRVNAICAKEIDKGCEHCVNAQELEDKKLKASPVIFLPVYVYGVIDVKTGQKVTYTEKDEQGKESEPKNVFGFRVLELPLYGAAFSILQSFRAYIRDEGSITQGDFTVEQMGSGQKKNFLTTPPKAPKPVSPAVIAKAPKIEEVRTAILGAIPPVISAEADAEDVFNANGTNVVIPVRGVVTDEVAEDDIPVF
jgi:hypothetical protein